MLASQSNDVHRAMMFSYVDTLLINIITGKLLCKNLDLYNIIVVYTVPVCESKQKARHISVTSDGFMSGNVCLR